jgi:hypothetical protein
LTAEERAALASLEAAAVADDPQFAAKLRGSILFRLRAVAPRVPAVLAGYWRAVLIHAWWGGPVMLAGLLMMWVGLSTSLAASLIGALVTTLGIRLLLQAIQTRLAGRTHQVHQTTTD